MEKEDKVNDNIDFNDLDGVEAIFKFLDVLSKKASQYKAVDETNTINMSAYLVKKFDHYYIYLIDDSDRQSKYLAIYDNPLHDPSAQTLAIGYLLCREFLDTLEVDDESKTMETLNQLRAINLLLFSYYPVSFIRPSQTEENPNGITIH